MRATIARILGYIGFICSFLAAIYWVYWIWQFDWGVSTRGRALMFPAMVFGAIIVFFVGYFSSLYAAVAIDRDA
ncbi:MAG: hypothetical protein QOI40_4215 [Alphaproteobacteria bacterium]|jgi:hypothetical protein|nr:hypothetical protein [Alphaproteobacteria bacterium]